MAQTLYSHDVLPHGDSGPFLLWVGSCHINWASRWRMAHQLQLRPLTGSRYLITHNILPVSGNKPRSPHDFCSFLLLNPAPLCNLHIYWTNTTMHLAQEQWKNKELTPVICLPTNTGLAIRNLPGIPQVPLFWRPQSYCQKGTVLPFREWTFFQAASTAFLAIILLNREWIRPCIFMLLFLMAI